MKHHQLTLWFSMGCKTHSLVSFHSVTSPSPPGAALHSDNIRQLYCSRAWPFVTLQVPLFSRYNSAAARSFITIASIPICYCIIPRAVNAKSLIDIGTWIALALGCVAFFQTSFSPKVWRDYPPKQYHLCYNFFSTQLFGLIFLPPH